MTGKFGAEDEAVDFDPRTESTAEEVDSRLTKFFVLHVEELARVALNSAKECASGVVRASEILADALRDGNKILACGNGGSAADAQHFVAELVGRYALERRPLSAVNLSSDTSIVTALSNDYGYEEVFARQVAALGRPGDVLISMSTSGRSKNVLRAVTTAHELGMRVVVLTGPAGDEGLGQADVWCRVGSTVTAHIQEIHTAMLHVICISAEYLLGFGER